MGCSDGKVRFITLSDKENLEIHVDEVRYDSGDPSVCLMHDSYKSIISTCFSSGSVHVFDKEA